MQQEVCSHLSIKKPKFNQRQFGVGFVVRRVSLRKFFLRTAVFSCQLPVVVTTTNIPYSSVNSKQPMDQSHTAVPQNHKVTSLGEYKNSHTHSNSRRPHSAHGGSVSYLWLGLKHLPNLYTRLYKYEM
jgi:hypothetical protein